LTNNSSGAIFVRGYAIKYFQHGRLFKNHDLLKVFAMWTVIFCDEFDHEFITQFDEDMQNEVLAKARALEVGGPTIGRPYVDTLKGSKHPNMKELRFNYKSGVWRVAFAFDPKRDAVILVAGNKAGTSQSRFYKKLIKTADQRYDNYLSS
tara:strand:+ start:328 stop:777 length:450 start_codon:yes stop_codon:yes gene_type:complete